MKKNVLWIIGFLGEQSCYLNVDKDEALRRYKEENKDGFEYYNGVPEFSFNVEKLEFDDEFQTYQIYNADLIEEILGEEK